MRSFPDLSNFVPVKSLAGVRLSGAMSSAAHVCAIPLLLALMSTTALSQSLFGGDTTGSSAGAMAIGGSSFASNAGAIAIGAPGSIGGSTTAAGPDSLALGNGASAYNSGSIAQGAGATAGVASGLTRNDIAIGTGASATGGQALAVGAAAAAPGSGGVALGNGALASGLESYAGGNGAHAIGSQATAIGNVALASGGNSVAIGNGSTSSGANAMAFGYSATAGGEGGTALGDRANAAGPGTISIGRNAAANQTGSLAIGDAASSTGNRSIALGAGALSSGGTVIGGNAVGSGGSTVIGENASAVNVIMGTALGNGAVTTVGGGVALGAGAVSSSPIAPATGTAISVAGAHGNVQVGYNTTDRTLQGAVSIGNATQYRQLQNVADGQNPTDAVNLRQLQGAVQASTLYTDTVAQSLQGQITTNATNIATNTANIATNTGNIATNAANIAANTSAIATNTANIATNTGNIATNTANIASLGTRVNDLDQTAVRYMRDAAGNPVNQINLNGAGDGGPVIIHNLAPGVLPTDAANTGQVQAVERVANNSLQYDRDASGARTNTVTLQGGDINAPVRIRNVAAGVDPTDAVNLAQLQGAVQTSTVYTDTVAQNLQGQITTNTTNIATNTTNIATNTANIAANTSGIATNAANIATNTANIATNTANIASLGTRVNDLDQTAVRYMRDAAGNPVNQINLNGAGDGGPVIIHNLAPGVLATDAANTGQVQAVERVASNSLQYDRDASGARTNIVTLQGGDLNAPVRVQNVAAGVNPTDAVNLAQMQAGDANSVQQANSYTDTRINNLTNLWEDRMRGMDRRISENAKQASAGTALALAASGIRFADTPGKWSLGGATALYRGQVGMAFGLGHTSEDGRVRFNAAITASPTQSRPQIGAVIGASFILN